MADRRLRLAGTALGAVLFGLGWALCRHEPNPFDRDILAWVEGWRSDFVDHSMVFITFLGNPIGVFLLSLVVVALLVLLRDRRGALYYIIAVGSGALAAAGLKALFGRERPETGMLELGSYAFPSWHASVSMALAAALFFIFRRYGLTPLQRLALWTLFLWPLLIGFTRIYLHVHWATDVIGGWGVGLFVASLPASIAGERDRADP
jgi:undecaprenyl-diphosphatase